MFSLKALGYAVSLLVLAAPSIATTSKAEMQTTEKQLTDPTRPADYIVNQNGASGQLSGLKLQQIVASAERKFAVIDGQKVKLGQEIGQYRVMDIQAKIVVLKQRDGEQITLTLFSNIKQ